MLHKTVVDGVHVVGHALVTVTLELCVALVNVDLDLLKEKDKKLAYLIFE